MLCDVYFTIIKTLKNRKSNENRNNKSKEKKIWDLEISNKCALNIMI